MAAHGVQGNVDKAVLAYSGGLDTSVILKWLREEYDCEVITFTADLGQVWCCFASSPGARIRASGFRLGALKETCAVVLRLLSISIVA